MFSHCQLHTKCVVDDSRLPKQLGAKYISLMISAIALVSDTTRLVAINICCPASLGHYAGDYNNQDALHRERYSPRS